MEISLHKEFEYRIKAEEMTGYEVLDGIISRVVAIHFCVHSRARTCTNNGILPTIFIAMSKRYQFRHVDQSVSFPTATHKLSVFRTGLEPVSTPRRRARFI